MALLWGELLNGHMSFHENSKMFDACYCNRLPPFFFNFVFIFIIYFNCLKNDVVSEEITLKKFKF